MTVHYGDDICDIIWQETKCPTTIYVIREEKTGTIAEFMDVFVTRKTRKVYVGRRSCHRVLPAAVPSYS